MFEKARALGSERKTDRHIALETLALFLSVSSAARAPQVMLATIARAGLESRMTTQGYCNSAGGKQVLKAS